MNVYIPTGNITDMRGPCDEGFHVPSNTEWQSVYNIWTALGGGASDWTNFIIALKIPLAGYRLLSSTIYNQGTNGFYRYSTPSGTNKAYDMYINTSGITPQDTFSRVYGLSVRCFKDSPAIPTSSWTKLYGTSIEAGGIFWDSSEGLISLSSDGQNWITIQDKNLGATTVYNYGDTLSEANCGKYYQWGNNYGFPRTGSVTTSSTQVDASSYGPGNYYYSSTFITRDSSPYDWSSVQNDNLRGGVTGPFNMNELKNAYIGEAPYEGDALCFTANTANSTVKLNKTGSPTSVTLETSTDGRSWSTYTFGDTITLSNVGDKVYMRNTSTTTTAFSVGTSNYYQFVMTGSISASGDVNYLLNKNSTSAVSNFSYNLLFYNCTSLTTPPKLSATTLANSCYLNMFFGCTGLISLPKLSVTTLSNYCYQQMFYGCTSIKLSTTQTGEYQTAYRIPFTGTGSAGTNSLANMFQGSGGTFAGTPSINTTYYTSNTVV